MVEEHRLGPVHRQTNLFGDEDVVSGCVCGKWGMVAVDEDALLSGFKDHQIEREKVWGRSREGKMQAILNGSQAI